jgi:hypothetical protein
MSLNTIKPRICWGKCGFKNYKFTKVRDLEIKGFSDKNSWRMKQFYETYKDLPKLSPLVREISWTNNLLIFSRCKTIKEMEFYLKLVK